MSTQFPIPTDNLYKFCALAGISIVALSIYFPGTLALKIDEQMFEVRMAMGVTGIETEHLRQLVDDNQQMIDYLSNSGTKQLVAPRGRPLAPPTTEDLVARHKLAQGLLKDTRVALKKQELQLDRVQKLSQRLFAVGVVGIFGCIFGLLLAIFGFQNWYKKIQLPLERSAKT